MRYVILVAAVSSSVCSVSIAQIQLDYTHDTFFAGNAAAKAALEQAVADINAVITTDLNPVTMDTVMGDSGGGTTATFNFSYSYTNPTTGSSISITDTTLPGSMTLFVGMRNLAGTTLGQGGPGGSGISASGTIGAGSLAAAIAAAEASYEHHRGGGPTIGNLSGTLGPESFSFDMGPTVGNLWFDSDTDNDGDFDTAGELADSWHFDHTTDVAAGKNDFYSVALHEVLHSVGYGVGDSWDALTSGTEWLGANGIAANGGTGAGLVDGGGSHLALDTMSTRISDGMLQEVVMDPNITVGTRKTLTALDVAVLQDLGWNVSAVPEPSSMLLLAMGGCTFIGVRRRRRAA